MSSKTSQIHTRTIPPGGVEPIWGGGDFFYLVESPGPVDVLRDGTSWEPYVQGTGEAMAPGTEFTRLELRNPSVTQTIRVRIYVGFGRYLSQRMDIMEAKTSIRCTSGTVAAAGSVDLSPVPGASDLRRKEITVSNGSPELRLYWGDTAGNLGGFILPGYSAALPVSGGLKLYNPAGAAVEFYSSEVWFVV